MTAQDRYDDAMFDFSQGQYEMAIAKLRALLNDVPDHFDAQLSIGMASYRLGDYATAIAEGHKAQVLKPHDQLVHTNLSLFYMKSGDKKTAEHHGLQSRIAGWREEGANPAPAPAGDPELQLAKPSMGPIKVPHMPWKKAAPAPAVDPKVPTQVDPSV